MWRSRSSLGRIRTECAFQLDDWRELGRVMGLQALVACLSALQYSATLVNEPCRNTLTRPLSLAIRASSTHPIRLTTPLWQLWPLLEALTSLKYSKTYPEWLNASQPMTPFLHSLSIFQGLPGIDFETLWLLTKMLQLIQSAVSDFASDLGMPPLWDLRAPEAKSPGKLSTGNDVFNALIEGCLLDRVQGAWGKYEILEVGDMALKIAKRLFALYSRD